MLMKGDLVRIPQSSKLSSLTSESWRLRVLQSPQIAIVLKHGEEKSIVLINNSAWEVKTKDLQLYGEKSVC